GLPEDVGIPRNLQFLDPDNTILYLFFLPQNAIIPLHNHQGMIVFSKMLLGKLHIKAYDLVNPNIAVNSPPPSQPKLASLKTDSVFTAPCNTSVLYPTSGGNIHSFTAITPCAILDVVGPSYSIKDGRDCIYYRDISHSVSQYPTQHTLNRKSSTPELTRHRDKQLYWDGDMIQCIFMECGDTLVRGTITMLMPSDSTHAGLLRSINWEFHTCRKFVYREMLRGQLKAGDSTTFRCHPPLWLSGKVSSPLVAGRCSGKPKGHRSKILPQQIGAIRGTPIPNYQELRMAGPTSEPITPLNRVTGSNNNNNDHSPSLQDQILNHISSLKTLIKEHNKKAGTLITPIRLTFGDEGG
ncbi:plant cysteine oxidase 2-like protein, partial [Tanacetum coccineum]